MERRSRFTRYADSELHWNERTAQLLLPFNTARHIPTNVYHALVGGNFQGLKRKLTKLYGHGYLDRRTFLGPKHLYETMTYSRTPKGREYLFRHGYPVDSDNNTAQDEEQVLIDLVDIGIQLATRDTDVEFHPWPDIREHPQTPPLPKHPHRFHINDTFVVPDGNPFYLKRGHQSILFLKEVIRTNKSRTVIKWKIRNYKQLEKAIKERYGFSSVMVLYIPTTAECRDNIVKWIGEDGPCRWQLVSLIQDHIKDQLSKPTVPLHLVNEPWLRAGHKPFSLKTLSEL